MWLGKGIIPDWLLKDMQKYGYKVNALLPDKEFFKVIWIGNSQFSYNPTNQF